MTSKIGQNDPNKNPTWDNLPKRRERFFLGAGFLGSAFAALCCIGFSVLVAFVSAVGAGFLIQDPVLIPILIVSLALSLVGLVGAYQRRHNLTSFGVGIAGIALTLISVLSVWKLGVYIGLLALLFSTGWNFLEGIREHRREHGKSTVKWQKRNA